MKKRNPENLPENIRMLIELLGMPQKGELNYDGKEKPLSRLDALRELKRLEETGVINPPEKQCGVNLHIHTNESFSVFNSPAEAAWNGYRAGLEVLGINDHYTIDGHKEFGESCKILGLKATFNIEAMAMVEEAKESGERYNDPKNPGRTYLCGKGVVHDLEPGSSSENLLRTMRAAFRRRCEEMTEKVNALLHEFDSSLNLSFDDVLRLTPRGNVTERHVAQAVTELISRRFPKERDRDEFLRRLLGSFDMEDLSSEDRLQDLVRNKLLKAGGPAYVEEPPEAFPGIRSMVQLFRDYGAIPTYPVLGNPVTEKESDLDSLFDELEEYGIFAVEVIPKRNTEERLKEILHVAEKHGFPVFNGTEHNTKALEPLLDKFSGYPAFLPVLKQGAYFILGHQFLSRYAGKGYVDRAGKLTIKNRKDGIRFFSFAGTLSWPEEVLEWLSRIGNENTFKLVLCLYAVLGYKGLLELRVESGFRVPNELFERVKIENNRAFFVDDDTKREFEKIAKRFVIAV